MTPLEHYQNDLTKDGFSHDAAQEQAIQHLQALYEQLIQRYEDNKNKGPLDKLKQRFATEAEEPVQGLYFWGGVGRGKTYLMDVFYDALPFEKKMRVHFHRFMQRVHHDLRDLQGAADPLVIIADKLSKETKILCFDEFFVSDITDAMILAGLMTELFKRGVSLVATSNIIPDNLYKDGLQRDRFLPAIALINKYTLIVNVDGGVDYRLRVLEQAEIYHYPLDEGAIKNLESSFSGLEPDGDLRNEMAVIEINDRNMQTHCENEDVVWFAFAELCDGPRSQNDYIEIAKMYHAVLISDVPAMSTAEDDMARRFVNMVDEFYDRNVKLIISAEVAIHELYTGTQLAFVFERTQSRLLEMQSHDYLAKGHLA